jgi:hypothetical protein
LHRRFGDATPVYYRDTTREKIWWPGIIVSFNAAQSREEQRRSRDHYVVRIIGSNNTKTCKRRSKDLIGVDDDEIATCEVG